MSNKYSREILNDVVKECISVAEVCRRFGISDRGSSNTLMKRRIQSFNIDMSHFLGIRSNSGKRHRGGNVSKLTPKDIFVYGRISPNREKLHILRRALNDIGIKRECSECGLGEEWNGKKLILHIDHINGDPLDNRINNIRYLCPNCHTQTNNYGHLNIKYDKHKNMVPSNHADNPNDIFYIECSECHLEFEIGPRGKNRKYCSYECAQKSRQKIDWPDNLPELVQNSSKRAIAKMLGVSDVAVSKRLRNHH